MIPGFRIITGLLAVCLFFSCSRKPETAGDYGITETGNPTNFSVYQLNGNNLMDKNVKMNNLAIDTADSATIDASVLNILNSTCSNRIVSETEGTYFDFSADFTAPTRTVSSLFYGMDLQWKSKYFLTMPVYQALLKHIKIDVLRFPGGQERVKYDRTAKTSVNDELGMNNAYQFLLTGEDVSNYISLCTNLSINAELQVNTYIDDPDMWSNMIDQVVSGLGYDLKYISVGNEPEVNNMSNWFYYNASSTKQAFSNYMERYQRYATAIDAVHPGITYILAESGSWEAPDSLQIMDWVLQKAGTNRQQALSLHWYMLGDYGQSPSDMIYPSLEHLVIHNNNNHNISYLSNIYAAMRQKANQYLGNAKLFIGEWGIAWITGNATTKVLDRLATAIFSAEVQEYSKKLGFDSLQWFGLSDPIYFDPWNPSLIAVNGSSVSIRPQFYIYFIYKYLWGNEIVDVLGGRNNELSVYASKDSVSSYLMLINRTESTTFTKTMKVNTTSGTKYLKLNFHPHSVAVVRFES